MACLRESNLVFFAKSLFKVELVQITHAENAVKYTPNGKIIASLQKNTNSIVVSIEDTGIGIAQGDPQTIFEEFHRAVNARNVSAVGTGLGLYLTKQVIDTHGGRIWVESDGISKVARFFVEILLG